MSHVCSLYGSIWSISQISESAQPLNHPCSEKKKTLKLLFHNLFESNYVSRCARGQGLKIKVPGCGVPQLETGLQCVHSSLEGGNERSALCVFFPPLPVSGLILRRWVMTPQVLCLLLWQCLPVAQRQNVSRVKHSGWKTSRQVVFSPSCRVEVRDLLLFSSTESLEVFKIFFLVLLLSRERKSNYLALQPWLKKIPKGT